MKLRGLPREFNLKLGIALAVMCGIFSSGFSFAISAAKPMQTAALALGVKPLYAALPSYVIIMGGGAIINMSYCFIRLAVLKTISLRADLAQPQGVLFKNGTLAATGGIMWYLQFFFYAWGAANIPPVSYTHLEAGGAEIAELDETVWLENVVAVRDGKAASESRAHAGNEFAAPIDHRAEVNEFAGRLRRLRRGLRGALQAHVVVGAGAQHR